MLELLGTAFLTGIEFTIAFGAATIGAGVTIFVALLVFALVVAFIGTLLN